MNKVLFFLIVFFCNIAFAEKSIETVFNEIYRIGFWNENGFSFSGAEIEVNKNYIAFLQNFMNRNKVSTVVDIGCGDWQFSRHIDWSGIQYTGYDVVKYVIERNKKLYEQPSIIFVHGDCLEIELPEADLLICKDVLQHLSNRDIFQLIKQLNKFKHCLIINDIDNETLSSKNIDTSRGGYHTLDLTKSPFSLPGKNIFTFKAAGISIKQVFHIERKN